MASGDTKTNQYLDIAANGTRADLPADTCCETRTQSLIRGVAERVMDVEDEVERLENNPDVVDIVATYQDLQNYDTSGLTDKDIIRVLEDSTHEGNSTYYRWNAATSQFDYIGEISGGSGITTLTTADYNYPTSGTADGIALWSLPEGFYQTGETVTVYGASNISPVSLSKGCVIMVNTQGTNTNATVYYASGGNAAYQANTSTGAYNNYWFTLTSGNILQSTGASTTNAMSQNAVTSMVYADPSTRRRIHIGQGGSTSANYSIGIGTSIVSGEYSVAIGDAASATASNAVCVGGHYANGGARAIGSVAIGTGAIATQQGQFDISTGYAAWGYNNSDYRLLTGLYAPQSDHDAANKEYVDGLISALEARIAALEGN